MADISKHKILEQAHKLCLSVEGLPAGEEQTKASRLASALLDQLERVVDSQCGESAKSGEREIEKLSATHYAIIKELCKAVHILGGGVAILAPLGSWGDTLPEQDVLELLRDCNRLPSFRPL